MKDENELLAIAEEEVSRARRKTLSRQPRYSENGRGQDFGDFFYASVYHWLKHALEELKEEPYQTDSRQRDEWLSEIWKIEPHWSGIIDQIVLVDSARPWQLIGGRNQVRMYSNILHNADDGAGWREFFRKSALAYRTTDLGAIVELGRFGRNGPVRGLYSADTTRFKTDKDVDKPLWYYPLRGRRQQWRRQDFIRIVSMPSIREEFRGLGWCATSRAFNVIKLLYGVLMHDQEAVGSKMPRGILFINGIDQSQWDTAMDARDSNLTQLERDYFGGVIVLASAGGMDATGQLMALSMLPDNFDRANFLDAAIYAYALITGYDPREFWPVSSGQMGTARETEMQHKKSATKGSLEFPHAFQEKLQGHLPDTLHFGFQERDTDAQTHLAELAQVWSEVVRRLYDGDSATGQPGIIDRDQALSILVQQAGFIPAEWSEAQEESLTSDEKVIRQLDQAAEVRQWGETPIRAKPEVQTLIRRQMDGELPPEPIVRYVWNGVSAHEQVLWDNGFEAGRPRVWQVHEKYRRLPVG